MKSDSYHVIGVMSGTSVDGLDLCYVHFEMKDSWEFKILRSDTLAYPEHWTQKLNLASTLNASELKQLDIDYTGYLADQIDAFIKNYEIIKLDAVCSHGHTVLHQPENQLTYQIGNLKLLAERLKRTVVCDFRTQDVEFGGQGAPLVPIGDELLFKTYDICLNLGGFANLSYSYNQKRIAYDICPLNILLNIYAKKLGSDYDNKGHFARDGNLNQQLLEQLNGLEYYSSPAPKSLGIEWVHSHVFPVIESYQIDYQDTLRTLVEHMAVQISGCLNFNKNARILVSGGGAYNDFLIERLQALTEGEIVIPAKAIIDYKEALIFGLLGVLKLRNDVNCLSSVTGSNKDHSSGIIFQG